MAFGLLGSSSTASRSPTPTWCRRAGRASGRCWTACDEPRRRGVTSSPRSTSTARSPSRDCVVPFLRRVAGVRKLLFGLVTPPAPRVPRSRSATVTRSGRVATRGGVRATPSRGRRWARRRVRPRRSSPTRLRTTSSPRIRWHVAEGHRVVIVSASYEHYVRVLADHLGLDGVAATRLAVGADGRLTGDLDGPNCRGPEKVARLHAWLAEHGVRSRRRDALGLRRFVRRPRAVGGGRPSHLGEGAADSVAPTA